MANRVDRGPQAAAAERHRLRAIRRHGAKREGRNGGDKQLAHFILL
jgi:hypothetical protein